MTRNADNCTSRLNPGGFSLAGWRHDWRNMDDGEDRLVTGSTAPIKDGEMKIEYQLPWVRLAENCLARLGQRAI